MKICISIIIKIFFFHLLFGITNQHDREKQISDVNVLLPICESSSCSKLTYTLYAYGGCFEWRVDKTGYIEMNQVRSNTEPEGCYHKVEIFPITKNTNNVVWITARDVGTNEQLRCRVGFNRIDHLRIEKRFEKINVGEVVEVKVNGYDEKDNMFSSLSGYAFHWKIIDGSSVELLKIHHDTNKITYDVDQKKFSDVVLLKGISSGKVTFTAQLLEEEYKDIVSGSKSIYVVDNFVIIPEEPVYMLPDDKFEFDLFLSNQNRKVLASERRFYVWDIEGQGSIEDFGVFYSAEDIGTTRIIAKDMRIDMFDTTDNLIHVVHPTDLDLGIMELSENEARSLLKDQKQFLQFLTENDKRFKFSASWKLVEGKHYLIRNFLMHEGHRIYSTLGSQTYDYILNDLSKYMSDMVCSHRNEVCIMIAMEQTKEYLHLESIFTSESEGEQRVTKTIRIFPRLNIEKFGRKNFLLPYLGYKDGQTVLRSQELRLKVRGGTGSYYLDSNNEDVVQVSDLILFGKKLGRATVRVVDTQIETNFDQIDIHVVEVKDMTYLEEKQEVLVGSNFFVSPVALQEFTMDHNPYDINFYLDNSFTNCTNLNMDVNLSYKDKGLVPLRDTQDSLSNYQKIISVLKNNQEATVQKLKSFNLEPQTDAANYLDYSNFGICDTKGFVGDKEGLVKLSFSVNIFTKSSSDKPINNKINSPNNAQVYIYTPLELVSPKLNDEFTNELILNGTLQDPIQQRMFILAYYSGITLRFSGGVMPWSGQQEDFTETRHVLERAKSRTYGLEQLQNQIKTSGTSNREFYLECNDSYMENEIVITNRNRPSPSLLRPGQSQISFTIGCNYPESLSVFLLGKKFDPTSHSSLMNENSHSEIFSVPQREGIEYYEKKNSLELVRVYAFDVSKRMFFNITTVTGEWGSKPSSSKLFSRIQLKEYSKYLQNQIKDMDTSSLMQFDYNSENSEYIDNAIHFGNLITKFELSYTLKKKPVSQFVKINLIDFPVLEPTNSTLYMTHDNRIVIDIMNGSGDFLVYLSDDKLADYYYDHVERKIYITPKQEGILLVHLKDMKIGDDFVVSSTVYISPVKRILLVGGGYLMVNNTMNISMRVYNNYDHVFPTDQVKKIPLIFEDRTHIDRGLEIIHTDESKSLHTQFTVRGLVADLYSIIILDRHSGVKSNVVKVEVFDKLEVFPPYLLMVPGSSYTLSIRGGPVHEENIVKEYEIIDKKIASVSLGDPEVRAHLIGKTTLRIKVIVKYDYNKFYTEDHDMPASNRTQVLTVEEIPVRVDFPESVEILGAISRKIFTKSTIRLLAALKKENEVFTYGTGPFKFDWALDNTLIAKIRYYSQKKSECSGSKDSCVAPHPGKNYNLQNSIGVFMKTYDQGTVEIKLTVTVSYPDPYTWRRPYTFTKVEKVLISDEIYVDIPEFYENDPNKSSLYLIPLDIDHELHTNKNKNFKYSLISQVSKDQDTNESNDTVITLSDKGRVTSHHKRGLAYVMITRPKENEKDKAPFVPVVLPILVTDFYSIFIERSHQLIEMEIGQEVSLKVIIQHEYGLLFAEKFDRLNLRVVESHPLIAKTELTDFNSKMKIKANSQGNTNVILFNPVTRKIYDVFQISVYSSVILPERISLNLGGNVSFLSKDSARKLMLSQDAEWISDDPSIVKIDPTDGTAVGVREGVTKVHLVSKDRSKIKLSTTVRVGRVKQASIDRKNLPKVFTNIKSSPYYKNEYRVPIKLYQDEIEGEELTADSTDTMNSIDQKLNFKCISNQPDIFIAESDKNSIRNEYKECIISIRDYEYNTNVPTILEMKVVAESQTEYTGDKYIYETLVKLPFTSAFKIKNNVKEITFTRNNRTNLLYVDNIQDLVVDVQDESVVKTEVDFANKNIKLYVPLNVSNDFHDVKLTLKNKLTEQKEEISLNYLHEKEEEPTTIFFGLVKRSTFIDFLTLILLLSIIYVLYSYLTFANEEKNRNIGPTTPSNRPMGSGVRGTLNLNY